MNAVIFSPEAFLWIINHRLFTFCIFRDLIKCRHSLVRSARADCNLLLPPPCSVVMSKLFHSFWEAISSCKDVTHWGISLAIYMFFLGGGGTGLSRNGIRWRAKNMKFLLPSHSLWLKIPSYFPILTSGLVV